jgi:hypothetical protein
MYDVSNGDQPPKASSAGVAFIVLAVFSTLVLMWWGFGGYEAITPPRFRSLFVQMLAYVSMALAVLQGFFYRASKATRRGALFGFLSPWAILALISVPQFFHSPGEVFLILFVPVLVFASHTVVEQFLHFDSQ